ncbi:serine protease [Ruficoccus sp. ZRK36]|uniref:S1 family peptidase n=1 Tax=Ruficoccus sp. ZRK36 TaxID=2866311 RepID=UPI001C72E770|nr:serine protease [Ruficoccus sp. ZRK36]QYY35743.1 serine protease [Ruficoccus sp. ZRK36]
MKPFIHLLLLGLLAALAPLTSRAETYVALPNNSFAVRYPINQGKIKLYPSQSFEIVSENKDAYYIKYDFGDAVHIIEIPKRKNGRIISTREGNTVDIAGMVVINADKGIILIEKGSAYPVTASHDNKLELIVPVGSGQRRVPFPANLFRLVEEQRYREATAEENKSAVAAADQEPNLPTLDVEELERLAEAEKARAAKVHAAARIDSHSRPPSPPDAVGLVTNAQGSGTGFLARLNGVVYFFTNSHVVGSGRDLKIRLRNGTELKPLLVELAADRDLARISIAEQPPALNVTVHADIGDKVTVYGNSAGAGVITEIRGKIVGDAFDRIETTAKFVPGNSGSPIVNKKDTVVAVATYAIFNPSDKFDWTMAGSGFDKVRRFGVKLDPAITWVPFHPEALAMINARIIAAEAALEQSSMIMSSYYDDPFAPIVIPGIDNPRLAQWITAHNAVVKEYASLEGKRYTMSERNKVINIIRNRGRAKGRSLTDFFREQADEMKNLPLIPRTGHHADRIEKLEQGFTQLATVNESLNQGLW